MMAPSSTAVDGRDRRTGRFLPGNRAGKGNPLAGQVARLRAALLGAVSPMDLVAVVKGLVRQAKGGDVQAAKTLLLFVLGPPVSSDLLERLEALEAIAGIGTEDVP